MKLVKWYKIGDNLNYNMDVAYQVLIYFLLFQLPLA